MKVETYESSAAASKLLAEYIVDRILSFLPTPEKPFVLGLPTGSSPEGVYNYLVQFYKEGKISFANVVTFNMDEYYGLPPTDEQSYHYFMYKHLFDHVDFKPENINILNGLLEDYERECAEYELKIHRYGRIHLFLGGLGPEGHVAFNETGSSRDSVTRKVTLVESTIEANSRFWNGDKSKVPKYALSVGISTVLDNSDEIIIIVFGALKRFALKETVRGKVGPRYPSTFLQEHSNVKIYTDKDTVKDWIKL